MYELTAQLFGANVFKNGICDISTIVNIKLYIAECHMYHIYIHILINIKYNVNPNYYAVKVLGQVNKNDFSDSIQADKGPKAILV